MTRRFFIPCLNQEPKLYNFNYGTIGGGVIFALFAGLAKGLIWAIGGGAIGASIGGWLCKEWFKGNFQRFLYWNFPYLNYLFGKNLPDSSKSHEL